MNQALDVIKEVNIPRTTGPGWRQFAEALARIPMLDKQTELDLAILIQRGLASKLKRKIIAGREAQRRLVFHNLRYAAWIVRYSLRQTHNVVRSLEQSAPDIDASKLLNLGRFAHDRLSAEDRFQAAVVSLLRAAPRYRPDKGAKFITYAAHGVIGEVGEAILRERYRDTLSGNLSTELNQVLMLRRQCHQRTGTWPTIEELAASAKAGHKAIRFRLEEEAMVPYSSLEDIERLHILDFVYDEHIGDPADVACWSQLADKIDQLFKTLGQREASILKLRFGFLDGRCYTLGEVGRVYGVTSARIRQIEFRALAALRECCHKQDLHHFLVNGARGRFEVEPPPPPRPIDVVSHPDRYPSTHYRRIEPAS